MRIGLIQTHQDRNRVVLSFMIVVAVAAGFVALLSIRPTIEVKKETAKPVETTVLGESDRSTISRLRQVGQDVPWQWRRRLVRRTAPSLSRWIGGMSVLLSTAGTDRMPAALYDRLALSFKSHELMRARFVIDADTLAVARDAGYHFGRRYAITFGDIIVFRDADAARDEIEWARQLVHLRLYRQWGKERFATKYLENWRRIDRTATRISARHAEALTAIYGPGEMGVRSVSNDGI